MLEPSELLLPHRSAMLPFVKRTLYSTVAWRSKQLYLRMLPLASGRLLNDGGNVDASRDDVAHTLPGQLSVNKFDAKDWHFGSMTIRLHARSDVAARTSAVVAIRTHAGMPANNCDVKRNRLISATDAEPGGLSWVIVT